MVEDNDDNEATPCEEVTPSTPLDAYNSAIEAYRECRMELARCEIECDIAGIRKDMTELRVGLSRKNRLLGFVRDARDRIQNANVEVVRARGMAPETQQAEKKDGILKNIVNKILKA